MNPSNVPAATAHRRRIRSVSQHSLVKIGRNVSLLLDAANEAENNAVRGEIEFLQLNLKNCGALAHQIEVLSKRLRQLIATAEKGARP